MVAQNKDILSDNILFLFTLVKIQAKLKSF